MVRLVSPSFLIVTSQEEEEIEITTKNKRSLRELSTHCSNQDQETSELEEMFYQKET